MDAINLPPHLRKPRLRRWEACEYLELKHGIGLRPATLAKMACTGSGPPFQKSVRTPLYPSDELDKWAERRLGNVRNSTSESP